MQVNNLTQDGRSQMNIEQCRLFYCRNNIRLYTPQCWPLQTAAMRVVMRISKNY